MQGGSAQSKTSSFGKTGKASLKPMLAQGVSTSGKHLIAVVDTDHMIDEMNETNNAVVSGPLP